MHACPTAVQRPNCLAAHNDSLRRIPARGASPSCSSSCLRTELLGASGPHRTSNFTARRMRCSAEAEQKEADMQPPAGGSLPSPEEEKLPPYRLILALAAGGIAETSYLTLSKLLATPVACPLSGSCDTVLSSGYAELFGIPLSAFGLVAYSSAAVLAYSGLNRSLPHSTARVGLLGAGTVLASCSAFLLYILATQFPGDSCVWCVTSATLSFSILAAVASAFKPSGAADAADREATQVAGPSIGLAALVLAFLGFSFSGVESSQAGLYDLDYQAPVVTRPSPPGAVDLAKRLRAAGAQMYGAFWCSHCMDQKEAFGADAVVDFPYVECYPDGVHKGTKLAPACSAIGLEGFPTWVINGEKVQGEQSFDALEKLLAGKAGK